MLRSGINRKNIVSTLYKWQNKCRKMNRFKPDTRTEFSGLCAEPKILSMFMRGCGRQKPEKIQKLRMIKRKLP